MSSPETTSPDPSKAEHPSDSLFSRLSSVLTFGSAPFGRLRAFGLLLAFSAVLLLPGLTSFGLWDPHEVRLIEGASEPISWSECWKPANAIRPRLPLLLLKGSLSAFGVGELGARLPTLLVAFGMVLSLFFFWDRQGKTRAGFLSGVVLLTMPSLYLGARQANAQLLPMLGSLWVAMGLWTMAWPRRERVFKDSLFGFLFLVPGLAVSQLTAGSVMGVAVPGLAVGFGIAFSSGPRKGEFLAAVFSGLALAMPVRLMMVSAQVPPSWSLPVGVALMVVSLGCAAFFRRPLFVVGTLVGVALLRALPSSTGGYSAWLSGVPHWPAHRDIQAGTLLKTLGFSLFPWIGLVPVAFVEAFAEPTQPARETNEPTPENTNADGPVFLFLFAWLCLAYFFHTLNAGLVQETAFCAVPAVALLIGGFLDRVLDGKRPSMVAVAVSGLFTVFVARDFFFGPEYALSAQLTEVFKWPAVQTGQDRLISQGGQLLSSLGMAVGVLFGLGLLAAHKRWVFLLVPSAATAFALFTMHGIVPAVTRHVSYRGIYTKYEKLGGGELGLFGVQKSSARVYGQKSVEISSLPDLFAFLHNTPGKRAFAIVGASEMASLDVHSFQNNVPYYVVDDSNSQFVLLSNVLGPHEKDLNPLRRLVSTTPPQPKTEMHVVFEDRIELIGFDLPPEAARGSEFVVRLYYRVLKPVGGNYRVFLHFDGASGRINGDHIPLGGKYPTQHWTTGQYITDEYRMSTSRLNHSAGYYQVFTGFWPGGDGARLKVMQGPHEPDHRVRLSAVRVK